MPLVDRQCELSYPGVNLVFGDGAPYLLTAPPDLGSIEPTTQDAAYPGGDGVMFGRDFMPGRTITLELGVNAMNEADNLAAHAALAAAWRGDSLRRTPGAVATLALTNGGRTRVVYGRPRNFASTLQIVPQLGYSAATVTFACSDDLFYDQANASVSVPLIPPPSGGLLAPLASPLTTAQVVNRPGLVAPGGLTDTWPVITIYGPVTNPKVTLTGQWFMQFSTTLAFDQSLTVDTRPWARTVLRNDGASLAGSLTRDSVPLSRASVPGATSTEVVYSGTDITGTSHISVTWQDAYPHL